MATDGLTPEQQEIERQAIERVQRGEADIIAQSTGETDAVPDGYNPDGTPIEEPSGELIGGKFRSNEDLLKAYQELEKKLGNPEEPPKDPSLDIKKEEAKPAEENPGGLSTTDFNSYYQEFIDSGSLSEDSYKALADKGLSKDVVDAYIAGQQAITDKAISQVHEIVGGEQAYVELIEWAKVNLSDSQKQEFNSKVTSNDLEKTKDAVEFLMYQKAKTEPKAPTRIQGDSKSAPVNGMQPFRDRGEYSKAVSNPLYGRDAKYTNMIDRRYLASRTAGTL